MTTNKVSKIALLIGINYNNDKHAQLNGCINDAKNLKHVLQSVYNYNENNIILLTDETVIAPTFKNICMSFENIAKQTHNNISEVFISFSGHGSFDYENKISDENDKRDECILPIDYKQNGCIYDDQINKMLSLFNKNVHITMVFDCCHSGTIADLKYRYISGKKQVIENPNCTLKSSCLCISGCKDNQVSMDAYNLENTKKYSGAMTSALLFVLKKYNYTINCYELLRAIRRYLKSKKFKQIPQITINKKLSHGSLFSCVNPKAFLKND